MANEEQVKRLLAGVEEWNRWRKANPNSKIDLEQADLSGAELRLADLRLVDFSKANLRGADLTRAHLYGSCLQEADLSQSILMSAEIGNSDLRRAILRGAILVGAKFDDAKLDGINFSGAIIGITVFANIDLSKAKGLDEVSHSAPSSVSTNTFQRSKGVISDIFLRGCGLSDWEIESAKLYQDKLSSYQVIDITRRVCQLRTGVPMQYSSCFISYSTKDDAFARRLHDDLQIKGVRCWFAPEDLQIGDKFRGRIDEAIQIHDKLLVVLSENSINSTWVEKEVETAFEKEHKNGGTVLFPIRLDDGVTKTDQAWAADIRRQRHIGDFSNWKDKESYQKAFERLLRDLKAAGKG